MKHQWPDETVFQYTVYKNLSWYWQEIQNFPCFPSTNRIENNLLHISAYFSVVAKKKVYTYTVL